MLPLEASAVQLWEAEVRKQWTDSILPQRTGAALGGVTKDIVGFVPVYADCHVLVQPPHLIDAPVLYKPVVAVTAMGFQDACVGQLRNHGVSCRP